MAERDTVLHTPPVTLTGLKLGKMKEVAAGMPAVTSSFKHIKEEIGLFKGLKVLQQVNQRKGFDCPGCAWPDPDDGRSLVAEYCENGAKAIAEEATNKRVGPAFFKKHSIQWLSKQSDYFLGKSGRLTEPMYLPAGASHYEPISWASAFVKISEKLNSLDSPDEAVFYTSGRCSNEAAFLYQLFVRQFGTNNLPDCSNMCHESSGKGLGEVLGIGKGSVTLDDFYESELIIVMGQNPGTNHPRMLSALQKAKRNGAKIISVNPLPETGLKKFKHPQDVQNVFMGATELTDHFLPVMINGDVALLKAWMILLLEAERKNPGMVFDRFFIKDKTSGFKELVADLDKQDFKACVKASGISEKQIRETAKLLIDKKRIIICWAMGLTQHKNGVANIQEIVNLLLLKGSIGKKGAGTCPVRGHSNVQGDRTMGIWEVPQPAFMDRLEKQFYFQAPRETGYNVVEAIKAMKKQMVKVFFALGGNFLSAAPDTAFTAEALEACDLTVQVSTKLNRSHLVVGKEALILPCLGRTERDDQEAGQQFVTVENSMGQVHQSTGQMEPASESLKSEPAIVAELAIATLAGRSSVPWLQMVENYDLVRDAIEQCIPGFENYNERVRKDNGFYLPNCAREGKFNTDTGKAKFTVHPMPEHDLAADEYVMMTIRSHDQYNTTIYGLDDRYRGIYQERRVVMMNEADMSELGLKTKDKVNLVGEHNGVTRVAECFLVVPYAIPRSCLATYFPEANVLVPIDSVAEKSHTPTSKYVKVRIEPI